MDKTSFANSQALNLGDRSTYLGASDFGALLGVNKYRSPLQLWMEKTGREPSFEGNRFTVWGNLLEHVLASRFREETGTELISGGNPEFIHPEFNFIKCHLDGQLKDKIGIWEGKTSTFKGDEWGEPGSDLIPATYEAQAMAAMGITGYQYVIVSVLFGDKRFENYRIDRNENLIDEIISRAVEFWKKNVQEDLPPPPTSEADMKALYYKGNLPAKMIGPASIEYIKMIKFYNQKQKEIEAEKKKLMLAIQAELGDHAIALGPDGETLATWKIQQRKAYEVKESEFRVFRIK